MDSASTARQEPEVMVEGGVPPTRLATVWRWARIALQVGLPALVIWLVWREVRSMDFAKVRAVLSAADTGLAGLGVLVAFLAVCVMGFYDAIAFPRGEHGRLGFGKRWLLGTILFGWTNFLSLGPAGGPAIRLLAYRHFGLSGPEVTRGFVGHLVGMTAGMLAWLLAAWLPWPQGWAGTAMCVGVALVGSVLFAPAMGLAITRFVKRGRFGSDLDGMPFAALGVIAFFDWGLTLVSFICLAQAVGVDISIPTAARTMFTGQGAGLASMTPGGLGTADAIWLKGLGLAGVAQDSAAAAVLAFRVGFYLIPWAVSLVVLYTAIAVFSERVRLWQRRVVAGATLLNAALLLLSAATPAVGERLHALTNFVPLSAIEASHLLSVACAGVMLFLVRGLLLGYRGAYVVMLSLLIASAVAHLLKGGDYEESIACVVLLAMLFGVRGAFTRKGRIPIGWELAVAAGLGSLVFFMIAGFAAFEKIPYKPDLWVTFAERAEASRFLRATVVLGVIVIAVLVRQALRPARLWITPTAEDIDKAEAFAREHADSADALLVGGGDKGVWFWTPKEGKPPAGMVLYQRKGDRLIVFKDPVVARGADPDGLVAAFLQLADDMDVEVVFALVSGAWMTILHDFGFHFLKINEEAIVPLAGYSLQGGKNANFRRALRDLERDGVRFEILDPPFDDALIESLRVVSDAWLAAKGGRELQFSACCFSPSYIRRNPIAVARDPSGKVVAFVNLLATRPGGPVTLDFMRYIPGSVDLIMDYLLLRTMLALSERGYSSFSLGSAPLSDVGVWPGSRFAERLLRLVSEKGERFYKFQGLLKYKSKFHPDWLPRYLAYRPPWDWASSLLAYTRLVQAGTPADRERIAQAARR